MNNMRASLGMMPYEANQRGAGARHVLRVLRRRARLFAVCFGAVLLLGVGTLAVLSPRYTATATVAIAPQMVDPLAPSGQQPVDQVGDDVPSTEAAMMMSRDVAASVLAQVPPIDDPGVSAAAPRNPAARQQAQIDTFLKSLTVVPELHSRVIDVSVTAKSGSRAALLADAVVSSYQRLALAQQTTTMDQQAAWLDSRTDQLRQRWLDAVQAADGFSVAHGLTNAGGADAAASPLVNSEIGNIATSLAAAQARQAAAQANADALHDAAAHGNETALISLSQQPILVAAATSLTQLESQRDQMASEFGPSYPKIEALNRQIAATRATVNSQTAAALSAVGETLVAAKAEVAQLEANLNQLRGQAADQSSPQAQYRSLSEEAASARAVYETFLEHENDVVDRAALLQPPVTFVSHAAVPGRPTFPNKPKLGAAILVLALVAGLAAVFAADHLCQGFEEVDDLHAHIALPLLACLPLIAARGPRTVANHVHDQPFSRASEAVRGLVSQLSLLGADGHVPRTLLVASASASEGKSTLALWLAMTVRQSGQSVLIIDGDHRRGGLLGGAKTTDLGLTALLAGSMTAAELIQTDVATGIAFIPAGRAMSTPFGAAELARLREVLAGLKQSYGLIVIDSPPLLAMTDALVYGRVADQTIFLCRWQRTSRKAVMASLDRLQAYGARVSGLVMSMVDKHSTLAFGGDYSRREIQLIDRLYGAQG
jgi:succinoglycan biosynthesis transport protein ExoP